MLNYRQFLLALVLGFSQTLYAQVPELEEEVEPSNWSITKTADQWLNLNSLRFTNRASCAEDSKHPSTSTFLLIDNLNLGRSLFRLGKRLGKDEAFTKSGVYRFRYTINALSILIANNLLTGQLPLLPMGEDAESLKNYSYYLNSCRDATGHCSSMDEYLKTVWDGFRAKSYKRVDNFTPNHFLTNSPDSQISCYYLKQFSPLEAHLYGTRPERKTLIEIAKSVGENSQYLGACDNFDDQKDLKEAVFQLDLRDVKKNEFDKQGFNFWHSFKLYLSWAFRNSLEAEQLAFPYGKFFKNVDLEEMIYFFSNGCKSLEKAECSRADLSLNSLRFLAQASDKQELAKLQLLNYVPPGAAQDIVENSLPVVNQDILNFTDFNSADSWASNFRDNLEKSRGFIKLKLSKALTQLSLVGQHLGSSKILADLESKKTSLIAGKMKQEEKDLYLQELYYLCSEYRVAMDERLSFLRKDLMLLKNQTSLNSIAEGLTEKNLSELLSIIDDLSPAIINHCEGLENFNVWDEPFLPYKAGLAPWYQEVASNNKDVKPSNLMGDLVKFQSPLLALKANPVPADGSHIVCLSGAHCSRRSLSSLIDVYASLQYLEGLLNLTGKIKTPDLVNPYAERVACKAYDPWFKTKSTIFDFMQNVVMAAVSVYVPTPIYLDAKIKPKTVVSFNQLMKDGKVYYDPKFEKNRLQATMVADFGALLGTPCMVSASNETQARPGGYWYLNGITIQVCSESNRNNINVYGPSEIEARRSNVNGCVSCTISVTNVAGAASSVYPGIRPIFFLVRGIVGLVTNLKDPHNIPYSWNVDLNDVYATYRKFGDVPKSCSLKLRHGMGCLKDSCEKRIVDSFEKHFKAYVSDMDVNKGGNSLILVNGCGEPITLKTPFLGCSFKEYPKSAFKIPDSCKEKFGKK